MFGSRTMLRSWPGCGIVWSFKFPIFLDSQRGLGQCNWIIFWCEQCNQNLSSFPWIFSFQQDNKSLEQTFFNDLNFCRLESAPAYYNCNHQKTGRVHQYQHHSVDLNQLASWGTGEVHLSFTHSFGEGNSGNNGVIQPTWLWWWWASVSNP